MFGGRRRNLPLTTLLAGVLALGLARCGDGDNPCRPGVPCVCSQSRGCIYDCPDTGCVPSCDNVDFCDASCGASCRFDCHNARECSVACGGGCDVSCHDVTDCLASVGAGSCVRCNNLSNCDVACAGDCEVRCNGVPEQSCKVTCRDGSAASECGGGVFVCGDSCGGPGLCG